MHRRTTSVYAGVGVAVAITVSLVAAGCSSGNRSTAPGSTVTATAASTPISVTTLVPAPITGASDRAVVRGVASLDGVPFDARWIGAVVVRGGLVTPCQLALPPVEQGHYEITVLAETESSGCGAPGARVVLWTYAGDKIIFGTDVVPWPGTGRVADFAARFSSATPAGAAPDTAEFTGRVLGENSVPLPPGARVDAYVGTTHCGTASVRSSDSFTGYVLAVVGPDAIAGCTRGATLSFRVNGRPAFGVRVVNTPPGRQEPLDLTVG